LRGQLDFKLPPLAMKKGGGVLRREETFSLAPTIME
jgi:hypothetical protein